MLILSTAGSVEGFDIGGSAKRKRDQIRETGAAGLGGRSERAFPLSAAISQHSPKCRFADKDFS